jgi:hypothetical protein
MAICFSVGDAFRGIMPPNAARQPRAPIVYPTTAEVMVMMPGARLAGCGADCEIIGEGKLCRIGRVVPRELRHRS